MLARLREAVATPSERARPAARKHGACAWYEDRKVARVRTLTASIVLVLAGCASDDAWIAPDAGDPPDAQADASKPKPDAQATVDAPSVPDVDQIPWKTGGAVGYGVASKDTENPLGSSMVIAYAGYDVDLASAEAWATALYRATLEKRGVRYIWAVQGPADPGYTQKEIGNSNIAAAMIPLASAGTHFILAVGHSSGSFVAHELFDQLASGADPTGVTNKKIVYFDLDGGGGFTTAGIERLKKAYFVGSHDGATLSPNHADMASLGGAYASLGGFWDNDASHSGCDAGAEWCVHVTLINTRPHDPTTADPVKDYSDFQSRPVCVSYVDAKANEAGLM
jgi:hypothetical protein